MIQMLADAMRGDRHARKQFCEILDAAKLLEPSRVSPEEIPDDEWVITMKFPEEEEKLRENRLR